MGMIDFVRSVIVSQENDIKVEILIRRTDNNNRERPDAHQRHGENVTKDMECSMNLVDLRDFEWLAWNYRTYKLQNSFQSEEEMVLKMFNQSYLFLPTVQEILHGIIQAQIDQLNQKIH